MGESSTYSSDISRIREVTLILCEVSYFPSKAFIGLVTSCKTLHKAHEKNIPIWRVKSREYNRTVEESADGLFKSYKRGCKSHKGKNVGTYESIESSWCLTTTGLVLGILCTYTKVKLVNRIPCATSYDIKDSKFDSIRHQFINWEKIDTSEMELRVCQKAVDIYYMQQHGFWKGADLSRMRLYGDWRNVNISNIQLKDPW